jgi:DNA-binding NarL/FixJ family response regulator
MHSRLLAPGQRVLLQRVIDVGGYKCVGKEMGMSVSTIKRELWAIRKALHARNVTHAAALAWQKGLIR